MTKYLIIALGIMGLLLAGAGLALKKQLQIAGEQRQAIAERDLALVAAQELNRDSDAAVGVRDKTLIQIKSQNRSLQNALKEAIANNACANQPIPTEHDRLLRNRAPQAGEVVPTPNPLFRTLTPGMGG